MEQSAFVVREKRCKPALGHCIDRRSSDKYITQSFAQTMAQGRSSSSLRVFGVHFLQCRQIPLCWHASKCPWPRSGRYLFRHRDADADVKPPVTRMEEEIGRGESGVTACPSAEMAPKGRMLDTGSR